ncbi:PREDICTED: serine/arginine-rich splicing factor 6-like [Dinoponera quadriceps]|uniref:Serine/arginine-rich splicing factor 6-like n=1 Tax=Dinoponera quadriceps TaxID=609295 RepID=A0A6P3XFD9_DINQU|nr:PREDICTED: serine/arginine-rich splicing factor 6-like [Dinoponera quadriceps]
MVKPKMSALVASAIRNLRELRGSTSKEIMNYIKMQYNATDANTRKQIYAALKRGLDYGILKKDHGYYSLNMDPDMLYKAHTVTPLEQGRRRRRRRGRGRSRGRGRGRRGRGRGRSTVGRGRGRGRRRRRRRRRRSGSRSRRVKSLPESRSLTAKCRCTSRKPSAHALRDTPVENLRKDTTDLYKRSSEQTPFRLSRSRDRSRSRSPSTSSDKEVVIDRERDRS